MRKNIKIALIISISIIITVITTFIGFVCYNAGYNENVKQPMSKPSTSVNVTKFHTIPETEDDTIYVYVTPHGKKYHIESCQYVSGKGIKISLDRAIEKEYTSCLVCNP